tara:strand:+ start:270 stop:524 length:255 start_codon:yes stop_codon:yes gene_type:complete
MYRFLDMKASFNDYQSSPTMFKTNVEKAYKCLLPLQLMPKQLGSAVHMRVRIKSLSSNLDPSKEMITHQVVSEQFLLGFAFICR